MPLLRVVVPPPVRRTRAVDLRVAMQHILPGSYSVEDMALQKSGTMPSLQTGVWVRVSTGITGSSQITAWLQEGASRSVSFISPANMQDPDRSALSGARRSHAMRDLNGRELASKFSRALHRNPLRSNSRARQSTLSFHASTNGFPSLKLQNTPQGTAFAAREDARRMVDSTLSSMILPEKSASRDYRGGMVPARIIKRNVWCSNGTVLHMVDRAFALDPIDIDPNDDDRL